MSWEPSPPASSPVPGGLSRIALTTAPPQASEPLAPTEPLPSRCHQQAPQRFLMRSSYQYAAAESPAERTRRKAAHHRAIKYRTGEYGYVEGFGDPRSNALQPKHYAKSGTFFGVRIRMNVRVLYALGCVEEEIRARCADDYVPEVLDGLRLRNTFYNGEVSNHTYGIAIDIDPGRNPCCGCLAHISDRPLCQRAVDSPFDRSPMPRCWVDSFERFGFYWLGYDTLEDTMHFEFLGDPDRIAKDGALD